MKKYISILLAIITLLSFNIISYSANITPELFKKLSENKNKIPTIEYPEYERIVLENGMIVYFCKDDKLPIIEMRGYILGGYSSESIENAGISDFMLTLMNKGTAKHNEQEFANFKGLNGIDISMECKRDFLSIKANSLKSDKSSLMEILAEVMINPNFNSDFFERTKQETLQGIAQGKVMDKYLLEMEFYKKIYQNHPYSFSSDLNIQMKNLTRFSPEEIKNFYNENLAPNLTVLTITGDFDCPEMKQLVKENFSAWTKKDIVLSDKKVIKNEMSSKKIYLINKPDATQAKLMMGYSFFDYNFDKRIEFDIANQVFGGGGFSSRLINNLRTEKGFIYSIYSTSSLNKLGGDYHIFTETKPENSLETIQSIFDEINNIQSDIKPIQEKELFETVNLYNALFPTFFKDKSSIINNLAFINDVKKQPKQTLNNYIKTYNSLTADEAEILFKKYVYPNKFVITLLGNKEEILPQFENSDFEIEVIEIQ